MKSTVISIIVALILIGGAVIISKDGKVSENDTPINNVSIVNGKQIVELRAKGSYQPEKSIAKAGIPTILRINTKGTFDCTAAIRIPSMDISKNLPPSGITDIDLGIPEVALLEGTCGMGMYPFEIEFKS